MKGFAPVEDYRVALEISSARRATPAFTGRGSNPSAKRGLTYERRVGKELDLHVGFRRITKVEHNPWFAFVDLLGAAVCSPDHILWTGPDTCVVVEVKLTWVPVALPKLRDLYLPVVERALGVVATPLVICRALAPGAGPFHTTLGSAIADTENPLLIWPAHRRIPW